MASARLPASLHVRLPVPLVTRAAKTLSSEFFQSLSNEDLNYLQITENDVLDLYRKYYLADKTVGQLTDTKNLEVSDAEAKVIQVAFLLGPAFLLVWPWPVPGLTLPLFSPLSLQESLLPFFLQYFR